MLGIFSNNEDIGEVKHSGTASFDAASGKYHVTGSGVNMWFKTDEFHFVWTKVSGDVALEADISFPQTGVDAHRKGALMIRQSLDKSSAYADAALHGDGLTSLQFRNEQGGITHEVQAYSKAPKRLRLEKRGNYVLMFIGDSAETMEFSGSATRIEFTDEFYIGLAVCSHNPDVIEAAEFSDVKLDQNLKQNTNPVLYSALETQSLASTDRKVRYVAQGHFEAPNWMPDNSAIVYNSNGRIFSIPVASGDPVEIPTSFAIRCNNDHGISPDGKSLVISDQSQGDGKSLIYTLPITGGEPKLITENGPSYWHGWSPSGKTLTYCAQRDGKYGIFTIPVDGGTETRLTTAESLDDGPEYSNDGKYIYFNSDRTGKMQIWRMLADGSNQEQVTTDEYNNWFAHPSPDGKSFVFLTYMPDVKGHPPNLDVMLRLWNLETGEISVLVRCFGGQGTINVPCWSPDSKNIAFVTYQLI